MPDASVLHGLHAHLPCHHITDHIAPCLSDKCLAAEVGAALSKEEKEIENELREMGKVLQRMERKQSKLPTATIQSPAEAAPAPSEASS